MARLRQRWPFCDFLDRTVGRLAFAVQPVTDAADGHDLKRRDARELLSQPPDVHVDRLAIPGELMAPDVLEEHVPRVHAAGKCEEIRHEVELARREPDVVPAHHDTASRAVDAEVADRVALWHGLRLVRL